MKSKYLKSLSDIFNLYRLPFSLVRKIIIRYIKKLFGINLSFEEEFMYKYFLTLISINGRCIKEDSFELITKFPSGISIISRKFPSSDLSVFYQVFKYKQYQPIIDLIRKYLSLKEDLVIFDIGGNIGCTGVFFKNEFPGSRIIILEPEISNFKLLQKNLALNKFGNVVALRAGLWTSEAYLEIGKDFRDKKEWAYYVKEVFRPTDLKGITISRLMEEYKFKYIDLLKIDIEGTERFIFDNEKQASFFLTKTRFIAMEIHDEFGSREKIKKCIVNNGFKLFEYGELTIGYNNFLVKTDKNAQ